MSDWRGYEVGMQDDPNLGPRDGNYKAIELIRQRLHDKYAWARDMGVTYGNAYDELTAAAITEFQKRAGLPDTAGAADFRTRARLGSYPPPPPPRHLALTFRGTGGLATGQAPDWAALDYTSAVARLCSYWVEESPILYPAAMGGIPVGVASDSGAPSGRQCVDIAVDMAEDVLNRNPNRTFVLIGYSLGAIAASRVRAALEPGGRLERFRGNYVCGVTFGNPSRAAHHTYYRGADPGGEGISDFHLPAACSTNDWCDLAHPDDIYTNVPVAAFAPTGQASTGEIMRDAYKLVMNTTVSDPLGTVMRLIPHILELVNDALGVPTGPVVDPANPLQDLFNLLLGAGTNVALGAGTDLALGRTPNYGALLTQLTLMLPRLMALLPGAFNQLSGPPTGLGAALQAAILGIKFAVAGTGPHIGYHVNEVWPGQTYFGLAVQHVNDWAGRVAVKAA